MESKLTNEDWDWVTDKYGNLLHHIAYRVGGDPVTHDHEDSHQELAIAVLDTVSVFDKSTGKPFSEYRETKHFDKYLKSVLWNRKNNMGQKITKREPLRRQVTIDESLLYEKTHAPKESFSLFAGEEFTARESSLLEEFIKDPRIIKPNGKFNISRISRNLKISKQEVQSIVDKLEVGLEPWLER